jgi:uncharacterized membrane protein YraQ (UPF0718 family)
MLILVSITGVALVLSFVSDREKTVLGIKKGLTMFLGILPSLLNILVFVSIILFLVPQETIVHLLGRESGFIGISIAAIAGSISLIPGFIAFPLAAVLIKSGVSYSVTAVFITTLLMVGVITLPLEAKYFGMKTAVIRNLLSLAGAIVIGIMIGFLM